MKASEEHHYRLARQLPMPVLAAVLIEQARHNIAYSEKRLLAIAADFWDAAEKARDRAELARAGRSHRPSGVLPDMRD